MTHEFILKWYSLTSASLVKWTHTRFSMQNNQTSTRSCHDGTVGSILARLSCFVYYRFIYSSFVYCCFIYSTSYFYLLLFASIRSIVIKFRFRFCMPLLKCWVYSFKGHLLTSYDVQIPILLFLEAFHYGKWNSGGYFFKEHPLTLTATWGSWGCCTHKMCVQAKREKTIDNSFRVSTLYILVIG